MEWKKLRKKYPRFIYKNYFWRLTKRGLEISFDFRIEPGIRFKPKLLIKGVGKRQIERVGKRPLENIIFHLGLIELVSYWKATCSPEIDILPGSLDKEQIRWWKGLIINGMGQYFYENRINFREANFLRIKIEKEETSPNVTRNGFVTLGTGERVLIPVGGGKDSVVTLEILKRVKKDIRCLSLNPNRAAKKIMKVAGCKKPIIIERRIDKKLLEMNQEGFLNGHTPFSAYLAFLTLLSASLFNYKFIAISNERSANEANLNYLDKKINHQWSKSYEFEKSFRRYYKKYIAPRIEYFSFLRPLYEIQIAKMFSNYRKYFKAFMSCNEAFKTNSGRKKPTEKWCGRCPKCLFVFTALFPFVGEEAVHIFKKNLFRDKKLLPLMLKLVGERGAKPFECVGTKEENLAALYLSWKRYKSRPAAGMPFLLKYFEKNILTKRPEIKKKSASILRARNKQNFIPKNLGAAGLF